MTTVLKPITATYSTGDSRQMTMQLTLTIGHCRPTSSELFRCFFLFVFYFEFFFINNTTIGQSCIT